jgi:glycosyltransferase involved in cell wall biosynthesis
VRVCLLSAGTDAISGGHRYHQHLLAAAPASDVVMWVAEPKLRARLPSADVVVIDSLYAWTAVGAVRREQRPRAVAIAHQHPGGTDGARAVRSLRRRVDLATYRSCDLVVTPGPIVARQLAGYGIDPGRVAVIEPGCDLPPADRHAVHEVQSFRAGRRLGLLNVANWLPNKGIHELLEAVAALPRDDVTLHLVGRTDVAPEYTRLIRSRIAQPDLSGRVVVHGALAPPALAAVYAVADAFAFPSRVESYGNAVAEALAAGVPVVGWRTPHLCALVDHDVEGLLVTRGRTDDLAHAIHRLAVDSDAQQRLAKGARRRGTRLPTWRDTTTRFFGTLARLVTESVEPPHDPPVALDVDPADPGVLDEQPLSQRRRSPDCPPQGGLDRTDMRHDDHD